MLLTQPEPLAVLQARYAAALVTIFDAEAVKAGVGPRPGQSRAHVFDTEDGLRLLVSRERLPDGQVFLHVSGSWDPHGELVARMAKEHWDMARALFEVEARWQMIAQSAQRLQFVRLSPGKGVPHFVLPEEPEKAGHDQSDSH